MNDEFGSAGVEMTDTWTCFGDPSLMVRTALPGTLTVIHDQILFLGSTQLVVYCNADGARATLSLDGNTLNTGLVENGSVTLTFEQLNNIGTATLTLTAFNYLPYIADIDIIPATGPYLVMESYEVVDKEGNDNGLPDYDESVNLSLDIKNVGIEDATDVMVTLSTDDPYITVIDYSEVYPLIPAEGSLSVENGFAIIISSDVPDQHAVTFNLVCTGMDETWTSTFFMNVNAPIININTITINDSEDGNGNGGLDPGESAEITINYSNSGHALAYDVDVFLEGRSGFVVIDNPVQNFGSIGFFGVFNKTFTVHVDENAPEGITVDFSNELTMGDLFQDRIFPVKISAKCEDFETGDFTQYSWQQAGNQPWEIVNSFPYEGYYSIKSGTITHNQTSEVSLTYNVMEADSIVFYRKVSSESSDMLKFYINNTLIEDWSGTTGGWKREAFAVTAGNKTFKWVYAKNNIGSSGSDCAWLDYIILPSPMALTIWAGPDDKTCTGSSFHVEESFGTDYAQIQWTTSGSGTFDDNTNMQPLYTPSADDIENGGVTLTLTLTDNENMTVVDDMLLGFANTPPAPQSVQGPGSVDVAIEQVTKYSTVESEEATGYTWVLTPAMSGTVIASDAEAFISWNQEFNGTAYLSVSASNECGESEPSEELTIVVTNSLVGIPEPPQVSFTVSVYPNPADEILNISITGANESEVTLWLVDLVGKTYSLSNPANLVNFRPGLYVLVAEKGTQRVLRKLLIR
jgi:hypothetical protein